MRTILFICTGNTCRSPLAEATARQWIRDGGLGGDPDVLVASAGVQAADGAPISRETMACLERLNIPYRGSAKALTGPMVERADLVVCMTKSHREAARALVADAPAAQEKVVLLDPDRDIEDPVGMGQAAYDALAETFRRLVPRRLKELLRHEDRTRV